MARKMFCELSPFTYWLSVQKNVLFRNVRDFWGNNSFSRKRAKEPLPVLVFEHRSTIRRVLGNVDMTLQENKAVNLSLAVPRIDGVVIYPGEVFSLWKLVGKCKASMGYREGVTITRGTVSSGIGGGLCQLSNLIHWMVLHSPLEIIEHHHHDGLDLFPDHNRRVPFGTGTSITYNYLDYRFKNTTDYAFQLCIKVGEQDLVGELRAERLPDYRYEVRNEGERFVEENGTVYRIGAVYQKCIDRRTEKTVWDKCIRVNHAKVMYTTDNLVIAEE